MRIVYTTNSADYFVSHRLPVALAARDAGYEVHVASPPSPVVGKIEGHGLRHHEIPLGRRSVAPWTEVRTIVALVALYRRLKPDLIHNIALKASLYGTIAARIAGVPAVINAITGLGYLFSQSGLWGRLLRAVSMFAAKAVMRSERVQVIFQNPDDQAEFESAGVVPPHRSFLIRGSGVDPSRYRLRPEPNGRAIVLFASRMLWDKGVGDFVEAARILRRRGSTARFVLVGNVDADNPRGVPASVLSDWSRSEVVEWWGRRDDMPDVFAQAAVVVLPSTYREGVPKVLIEAAACGRPIVATKMPGCTEIVRDGVNGLHVPAHAPTAIADALERLLRDPEQRRSMGKAGRDIVEREFAAGIVVKATLDLYEAAVPGRESQLRMAG